MVDRPATAEMKVRLGAAEMAILPETGRRRALVKPFEAIVIDCSVLRGKCKGTEGEEKRGEGGRLRKIREENSLGK
jgi:hypothetical protein